jgi:hypothetical protein
MRPLTYQPNLLNKLTVPTISQFSRCLGRFRARAARAATWTRGSYYRYVIRALRAGYRLLTAAVAVAVATPSRKSDVHSSANLISG